MYCENHPSWYDQICGQRPSPLAILVYCFPSNKNAWWKKGQCTNRWYNSFFYLFVYHDNNEFVWQKYVVRKKREKKKKRERGMRRKGQRFKKRERDAELIEILDPLACWFWAVMPGRCRESYTKIGYFFTNGFFTLTIRNTHTHTLSLSIKQRR